MKGDYKVAQTIKLGQEVEDRVTGFQGIAVSRTTYLQGCDRIAVQPKWKEGEVPIAGDFDEPDLIIIGSGILPSPVSESLKDRGGPRPIITPR